MSPIMPDDHVNYYLYYAAIGCFFASSSTSDLLIIRVSLMSGFVLLALAAYFSTEEDSEAEEEEVSLEGTIFPFLLYTVLFLWNLLVCIRLVDDSIRSRQRRGKVSTNDNQKQDDQALFNFFQRRCGLTRLEFEEIRRHGDYVELNSSDLEVPNVETTLYLVLEGLVECETHERGGACTKRKKKKRQTQHVMFPKRSGQFFDLKFFNLFSLPVGFDSLHFRATTATPKTRLFAWPIKNLIQMRDSKSPNLRPFWEYMILRTMAHDSIRHHLQEAAAAAASSVSEQDHDDMGGSASWVLPEHPQWLDGGISYEFNFESNNAQTNSSTNCCSTTISVTSQFLSLFHLLPPKGIRNQPPSCRFLNKGQHHGRQRQECIETVAKAKQECMDIMEGTEGSWQNVLFMSAFGGCFYNHQQQSEQESNVSFSSSNDGSINDGGGTRGYNMLPTKSSSTTASNERLMMAGSSSLNRIVESKEDEQPTNASYGRMATAPTDTSRTSSGRSRNTREDGQPQQQQPQHSTKREYLGNAYKSLSKEEEESLHQNQKQQSTSDATAATPRISNHYMSSSVQHTRIQQQQHPIHNINHGSFATEYVVGGESFQQFAPATTVATTTGMDGQQSVHSSYSYSSTGMQSSGSYPSHAGAYPTTASSITGIPSWNSTEQQSYKTARTGAAAAAAPPPPPQEASSTTRVKSKSTTSNSISNPEPKQHETEETKEETKTEIQPPLTPPGGISSAPSIFEAVWQEDMATSGASSF